MFSLRRGASGFIAILLSMPAFAAGREGEAYVEPVRWIVGIVLVAFIAVVGGGVLVGAFKASKGGESILKGGARGLLKGLLAFLVVGAVSVAVLTILSILWIAYSFLDVYALSPS